MNWDDYDYYTNGTYYKRMDGKLYFLTDDFVWVRT